jgi:hypothetical protein
MQTFLPYPNFLQSCQCLDYRRLGKQRVEAVQIINAAMKGSGGWVNHPATRMWAEYLPALMLYANVCIQAWVERGYKNNMVMYALPDRVVMPHWLGDEAFHASHRSNLLRKAPAYYSQFGWTEGPNLPYVWPV